MTHPTSDPVNRPRHYGLFMGPILSFVIGVTYLTAGLWKSHWDLVIEGIVGLVIGAMMVRANIRKGWGWHGQGWPDER